MMNINEHGDFTMENYAWHPADLHSTQIQQYMNALPREKVPLINSVGERYRIKQLLYQLPPHDNAARYCNSLSDYEKRELEEFNRKRKMESLGKGRINVNQQEGTLCSSPSCLRSIPVGKLIVQSSRAGPNYGWHPECFVCKDCQELLVDLIYFWNDGLYCGRHYAETIKPRCYKCDELIFEEECTEAENKSWHIRHFLCSECGKNLGGQQYAMNNDSPFCSSCYSNKFKTTGILKISTTPNISKRTKSVKFDIPIQDYEFTPQKLNMGDSGSSSDSDFEYKLDDKITVKKTNPPFLQKPKNCIVS